MLNPWAVRPLMPAALGGVTRSAVNGSARGRVLYPLFRERLQKLADKANGIGWGYGDHIDYIVESLKERWSKTS